MKGHRQHALTSGGAVDRDADGWGFADVGRACTRWLLKKGLLMDHRNNPSIRRKPADRDAASLASEGICARCATRPRSGTSAYCKECNRERREQTRRERKPQQP